MNQLYIFWAIDIPVKKNESKVKTVTNAWDKACFFSLNNLDQTVGDVLRIRAAEVAGSYLQSRGIVALRGKTSPIVQDFKPGQYRGIRTD